MSDKYDQTVAFYLVANDGNNFQGRDIWDVMLCLGLNWGDMDCFHWTNPGGTGDDSFFSVETSMAPGYFLPEQIAAGELQTSDLVFIFSVPRTCEPTEVAKRMDLAVKYCQKRLGGNIHYALNDRELPLKELMTRIDQMSSGLKELGFEPGTGSALRML
ncbi:MAG: hypothetical protein JNL58_22090 [Planctomyces sp.]|nr:hypothetical protein [Planctomyces sp.]